MAKTRFHEPEPTKMSFEKILTALSRDESFKATVYAMNTLLIHKGIFTQQEFETLFVEWGKKEISRKGSQARHEDSPNLRSA